MLMLKCLLILVLQQINTPIIEAISDMCKFPAFQQGPCKAHYIMYSFNETECVRWVYGGCGGNQNRFHSMEACEQYCLDINPWTPILMYGTVLILGIILGCYILYKLLKFLFKKFFRKPHEY